MMQNSYSDGIYRGAWINWTHGPISGSTITLSKSDGALLTSFLAIFVTASGSACWKIISYILHQIHAKQEPQDGLHRQTQVVFRNTGTAVAAALQVVQLAWYWRKTAVRPFARVFAVLLLALLNVTAFGVAGIFSSQVTKAAGDNVLVRSAQCGTLDATTASPSDQSKLDINDILSATTYAQLCYEGEAQNLLDCYQYVQPSISVSEVDNASCPFPSNTCVYGATGAYSLDSGLIDSHADLGLNARKSQRVQYRKVTTCSPLNINGYTQELNDTDTRDISFNDTLFIYVFGSVTDGLNQTNYTFRYDPKPPVATTGYSLTSFIACAGSPNNSWVPDPTLNRTDGDISLFFLAPNSVLYEEPVTDPFYMATDPVPAAPSDPGSTAYYFPDWDVSAMACIDQHQFCNPNNKKCTQLSGVFALNDNDGGALNQLALNDEQNATAQLINGLLPELTTYANVHTRGANALRASETIHGDYYQVGLPVDQWQQEVSAWFGVAMARLQQNVVQYATGPPYLSSANNSFNLTPPQTKYEKSICNNTIIQSTGTTTSFSALGVAIILTVGTILIVTSLLLDTVVQRFRQWTGKNEYKSLHYILDGNWQLQRLAYEGADQGHWNGVLDTVPVTTMNDRFGLPGNNGVLHPHLGQAEPVEESHVKLI